VPSAVRNWLPPLYVGGNTSIAQGTTRNVAGGQTQPVAVQNCGLYFLNFCFFLTNTSCMSMKQKVIFLGEMLK
jgi:hypothetical protein